MTRRTFESLEPRHLLTSLITALDVDLSVPRIMGNLGDDLLILDRHGVWVTDGTTEGTLQVKALNNSFPRWSEVPFLSHRGNMFFAPGNLWVTDGTSSGTHELYDRAVDRLLGTIGDFVYFQSGSRVFGTDGTVAHTLEIESARGLGDGIVSTHDDKLYALGDEFVVFDPMFATKERHSTLRATSSLLSKGQIAHSQHMTIFFAEETHDQVSGRRGLWKTENNGVTVELVFEFAAEQYRSLDELITVADQFYFVTERDASNELWISDGTTEGTQAIAFSSSMGIGGSLGDNVVFKTATGLWQSVDGTIEFIHSAPYLRTGQSLQYNDSLILFPETAKNSTGVWITDGTHRGTRPLFESIYKSLDVGIVDGRVVAPGRRQTLVVRDVDSRATPDIDRDGQVGFSDFLILSANFGSRDVDSDFDNSGTVDFIDFLMLSQQFNRPGT